MSKSEKRRSRIIAQPPGTITYTVGEHDSLASIAAQFDTTTSDLKRLNRLMSTMIFQSQELFVPDKDYVPSSDSCSPPVSPLEDKVFQQPSPTKKVQEQKPPDIPLVGMKGAKAKVVAVSPKRAPGYAERQTVEIEDDHQDVHAKVFRPVSREAREELKSEEEHMGMFLKMKVKYITNGKGVVNGVLLVTTNTIMFDPDVSDSLVMEKGREMYMISASLDTLVSMKILDDIVAMNASRNEDEQSDEAKLESQVYHANNCDFYKDTSKEFEDEEKKDQGSEGEAAAVSPLKHSASTCSCGAESMLTIAIKDASRDEQKSGDKAESQADNKDKMCETITEEMSPIEGAASASGISSGPKETVFHSSHTYSNSEHNKDKSNGSMDKNNQPKSAGPVSDTDDDIFQFDDAAVSGHSPVRKSSPESSERGIFRRTLGSVGNLASSLGSSLPNTPNMSSLVNFKSGLFSKSSDDGNDKVKDISEVDMISPPRASWSLGDSSPSKEDENISMAGEPNRRDFADERERKVETAVRYARDRADLFKRPDAVIEIIPRPAAMYEKKPKYLCLIIHAPLKEDEINKLSDDASKKGLKKVRRVELWFSIPEDKVNNLYDFFIHWTPDKYGESESDIDPELCGFVVVDEDGRCDNETDDIEFIDDHYSKSVGKKSLSRSYSTTWEIVRKDEARRRILEAEEENLPPPELNEKSSILTDSDVATLNSVLLPRAIGYSWSLTYSTNNHGISLKTLYRSMRNLDCPVLLCVKDSNNQVFGAMLPSPIVMSDHFYGTGESFLWTFYNGFKRYKWTGHNNFFIKGNTESLAIGAGFGSFGLWLDGDLNHGRTQKCQTYNNELLTEREDFMIRSVEVWSFV